MREARALSHKLIDIPYSETQLRSRLKKWRVTKPSRQTRKKSPDGQFKATDGDSGIDGASPKTQNSSVSPRTPLHANQQPAVRAFPATEPDWYMSHKVYAPSQGTSGPIFVDDQTMSTWPLLADQQPSPSPSDRHTSHNGSPVAMSGSNAFHQRRISQGMDTAFVNATSTVTHTFSGIPLPSPLNLARQSKSLQRRQQHLFSGPSLIGTHCLREPFLNLRQSNFILLLLQALRQQAPWTLQCKHRTHRLTSLHICPTILALLNIRCSKTSTESSRGNELCLFNIHLTQRLLTQELNDLRLQIMPTGRRRCPRRCQAIIPMDS